MSAAELEGGDWIRAITIRQPWVTCILAGKSPENRPANWPWRGWVLLHTSRQIDRLALRTPLVSRTVRGRELVTGAVVGAARLTDCHQDPDGAPPCTEWAQSHAWHLVLVDVQEFALPIPARGQLGPWKPTPDLLELVCEQLPRVRP